MVFSLHDVQQKAEAAGLAEDEQDELVLFVNNNPLLLDALTESNWLRLLRKGIRDSKPTTTGVGGQSKQVYIAELSGDGSTDVNARKWTFKNRESFAQFLRSSGCSALLQITGDSIGNPVIEFEDLVPGETYLERLGAAANRIEELRRANTHSTQAEEEEFGVALCREISHLEIGLQPQLAHELRLLEGAEPNTGQEFDAVVLAGPRKAILGERKRYTDRKSKIMEFEEDVSILQERADQPDIYPDYRPFQGRELGLAFMADFIPPKSLPPIEKYCAKKGIALFSRNGKAIHLRRSGMAPGLGFVRFA